jgi:hypothetical protein
MYNTNKNVCVRVFLYMQSFGSPIMKGYRVVHLINTLSNGYVSQIYEILNSLKSSKSFQTIR